MTTVSQRIASALLSGLIFCLLPTRADCQSIYEQLKLRQPTPTLNHLTKVRYGAGNFLAVGENGTLISSDAGAGWTLHDTGYSRTISDIAFGNGIYIASALEAGTLLISTDLTSWEIITPAGLPYNNRSLIFHAGKFYMCGSGGTVSTSTDGTSWETFETGTTEHLEDITYGGGQLICVGANSTIATSPDSVNWTLRPVGFALEGLNNGLLSVHYLNGQFVVGGKNGTLLTSVDGIEWTQIEWEETSWVFDAIFHEGHYYLCGANSLHKTSDFSSWEAIPVSDSETIYGITQNEGQTVTVGRSGEIFTSPDLIEWTPRKGGYTETFIRVVFADEKFVLADFDGIIRTSNDSLAWTDAYEMPGGNLIDFIYADGKFVAVNHLSEIIQSPDGTLWSTPERQFEGFPNITGIRYANGRWFLIGRNGLLRSSGNLMEWSESDLETTSQITDIIYANDLYVAVGDGGLLFTSTDAIDWVARDSGTTRRLNGVVYGNGKFVIGGSAQKPLISINGIDWTEITTPGAPSSLNTLEFTDGQFIGLTSFGRVISSPDGEIWTTDYVGVSTTLRSLAQGNERLVAVGNNGLIMSTNPLPDHLLSISVEGSGTITTQPAGLLFKQGTMVELIATPSPGSSFLRWEGDVTGDENPLSLTVTAPHSIKAVFQASLTGYELWKLSNFTESERNNPDISGSHADPDADKRTNVYEYLGGTNPKSANIGSFTTASSVLLGDTHFPLIQYIRKSSVTDIVVTIEISDDLVNWNSNGDGSNQTYTSLFNLEEIGDGLEAITYRSITSTASDSPLFMRLNVVEP